MRIKNSIKIALLSACLVGGTTSCSNWLEVKMEDRIMENTLFSTNGGYLIALNGAYLGLNTLYSQDLTTGIMDVLAQYYNVTENINHSYKIYAGYKYDDVAFESRNSSIWSGMYTLLANVNVILEHCDGEDAKLSAEYYPVVKGEALALRAMLHFDLLRLYGPVYSAATASTECMPYQESSRREIQPLLSAESVLNKVITDLEEAVRLLKEGDPILTDGVGVVTPEDNGISDYDFSFRQLRLNYYAAQALLARAYLWKGDKKEAYRIAKNEIIDKVQVAADSSLFPWTSREAYGQEGKEDYMFSSEVFFALYNSKRTDIFNSLFSKSLTMSSRLTFVGDGLAGDSKVATLYDDDNDWRKKMWGVVEPTEQEKKEAAESGKEARSTLAFAKYKDFSREATYSGADIFRYMVPLIRLSEIYLIAAECSSSTTEAWAYINEIRRHRDCQDLALSDLSLSDVITKEFAKEVIGEGQLFFYYKRLAKEDLIPGTSAEGAYSMVLSNYVWPLPDSETDKRVSISKK